MGTSRLCPCARCRVCVAPAAHRTAFLRVREPLPGCVDHATTALSTRTETGVFPFSSRVTTRACRQHAASHAMVGASAQVRGSSRSCCACHASRVSPEGVCGSCRRPSMRASCDRAPHTKYTPRPGRRLPRHGLGRGTARCRHHAGGPRLPARDGARGVPPWQRRPGARRGVRALCVPPMPGPSWTPRYLRHPRRRRLTMHTARSRTHPFLRITGGETGYTGAASPRGLAVAGHRPGDVLEV